MNDIPQNNSDINERSEVLPLQILFYKLKEIGFQIGIEEYRLVLQSLQMGIGISNARSLAQLCRTVWVTSVEEIRLFDFYFEQIFLAKQTIKRLDKSTPYISSIMPQKRRFKKKQISILIGISIFTVFSILGVIVLRDILIPSRRSLRSPLAPSENIQQPPISTSTESSVTPSSPPLDNNIPSIVEEPQQSPTSAPPISNERQQNSNFVEIIILGVFILIASLFVFRKFRYKYERTSPPMNTALASIPHLSQITPQILDELHVAKLGYQLTGRHQRFPTEECFPVTSRQMKQSWRNLRRMVRQGPAIELDLVATVEQIGRQGQFLQPVFRARQINRVELLLLIDKEGSMAPFRILIHQLVETALKGGQLKTAGVYYFHNCPSNCLYRDPEEQQFETVEAVLRQVQSDYAGMVIFSDAGAARGCSNLARLKQTRYFLDQARQWVRYLAWLNPMPQERWAGSTAARVAQLVPMFEFSRQGLDNTIAVLQGLIRP